jgi:hypothetical protein
MLAGLMIPVDHARLVGIALRVGHLATDLECIAHRQLAFSAESLAQGLSLDIGHDIVEKPVGLVRVVQRQDVRMVEAGRDLNLVQKPSGSHCLGQLGKEHLDRYRALILEIVGQEYLRHPALPQLTLELVAGGKRFAEAFE